MNHETTTPSGITVQMRIQLLCFVFNRETMRQPGLIVQLIMARAYAKPTLLIVDPSIPFPHELMFALKDIKGLDPQLKRQVP